MPVLDRQAVRRSPGVYLPPSLQGLPPRSVPEVAPTPLQHHYVLLSVPVLIAGTIAITALELGASPRQPARQAVRPHRARRCSSSRPPTRSCGSGDRPGRGCRRSRQGPVPAGLGGGQPGRARARSSAPRRSSSWPGERRAVTTTVPARSGRPLDRPAVRPRRPVVARRFAQLLLALRGGAALRRGPRRGSRPARLRRRAATSSTSTRGSSSRPSRSPTPARSS